MYKQKNTPLKKLFLLPLAITFFLFSAFFLPKAYCASNYPQKPVRILVPFAPGGGSDLIARQIGSQLTERLGQSVVIDNRPAAAGILATELVSRADPDGYTLLIAMSTQAAYPALYPKLPFDAVKSFAPITVVGISPLVAVLNAPFPATSVQTFIAYAKNNPTKINFGSSGAGSPIHLAGELFKANARIEMTHIPYKGIAPAIAALMGNEIQILFPAVFLARPHVASGRLRVLGVTSTARSNLVPQWPTLAEAGMHGFESSIWYGVMAPAMTPDLIIGKLNREIVSIIQQPEVKQYFFNQGIEVAGSTSKEFYERLTGDVASLGKLIRERGIRAD